jgi:uncharacterized protein (DUF58 family)
VWIVLDASVELWAGDEGKSPLDAGVDEVGALAAKHLARGDQVGLVVMASRLRTWLEPDSGPAHAVKIGSALSSVASMVDADRSDLDEIEVAQRVAEHARPLDARGLADIVKGDLDALAKRAESLRMRAPFAPRLPFARTPREATLRHYIAAFGIEVPPRSEGERERTEATLAQVLERIAALKPRPSAVHVWAPPPSAKSPVIRGIRTAREKRLEVRWTAPPFEEGVSRASSEIVSVSDAVDDAVRIRAIAARERGGRLLRQLGVKWMHRAQTPRVTSPEPEKGAA